MVKVTRSSQEEPVPPKEPWYAWIKNPHWSPRTVWFIGVPTMIVGAFAGAWAQSLFASPLYVPSTIFQASQGSEPQKIEGLTAESRTCDAAIRSLLLAFANEIDGPDPNTVSDAVAKTRSLVETDLAVVPTECQQLIDPRSSQSVNNLRVSVRSLTLTDYTLTALLTITNTSDAPVHLAFEDYSSDKNLLISDNVSGAAYQYARLGGVHICSAGCKDADATKFTRIDPQASALITVEGKVFDSLRRRVRWASLSLTLITASNGAISETVSFGFQGVPLTN